MTKALPEPSTSSKFNMRPFGQYFRTWAASGAGGDVGDKQMVDDVVRQYDQICPIFGAHQNVQKRSTGNTYSYTKITRGNPGHTKTEGVAAAAETTSTLTVVEQSFKLYTGDVVSVSTEMMQDAAFDVGQEVLSLGLGKTVPLLGADLVAALKSAFLDGGGTFAPTATIATTWDIQDLANAYYEIPARNRKTVQYTCNTNTAKLLTDLLTSETAAKAEMIGFSKESVVEDPAIDDGVLFVGNVSLGLAIGMKVPLYVRSWEVSAGGQFEINPRFAVGLRDATALACRKLRTS